MSNTDWWENFFYFKLQTLPISERVDTGVRKPTSIPMQQDFPRGLGSLFDNFRWTSFPLSTLTLLFCPVSFAVACSFYAIQTTSQTEIFDAGKPHNSISPRPLRWWCPVLVPSLTTHSTHRREAHTVSWWIQLNDNHVRTFKRINSSLHVIAAKHWTFPSDVSQPLFHCYIGPWPTLDYKVKDCKPRPREQQKMNQRGGWKQIIEYIGHVAWR